MKFCYNETFAVVKIPKNLDPSDEIDLDFWDCFGKVKNLS